MYCGCGNKKQRTSDSVKLLDFGFKNYEIIDICKNMKKEFEIKVEKGKANSYKIMLDGEIMMPIEVNKKDKITYKYEINSNLKAPIENGQSIGKIYIYFEENLLKTININLPQNIERKEVWDYFKEFLKIDMKNYEIKL